jgi:3-oxoacyl-[acyl-carrier protein] reductase
LPHCNRASCKRRAHGADYNVLTMERILAGKIAIVTGGTRGIGRAIAERLLAEGASVAVCGRSAAGVDRAVTEMTERTDGVAWGAPADVSKLEDVRRFFQAVDSRFGGLDILVNNAGVGIFRSVSDLTPEEWHSMLDLNLSGVYYCSHEALQRFRTRGGGYIINVSSLAGKNPFGGGAGYNASKFGLNGFSEARWLGVEDPTGRCGRGGRVPAAYAGANSGQPGGDSSRKTQEIA